MYLLRCSMNKCRAQRIIFWGIILIAATGIFLSNTSSQLGSDDVHWITGSVATEYDSYRVLPRLLFSELHHIWGANLNIVYGVIYAFHLLNAVLLYRVSNNFWKNELAATISTIIFLINPLTLGTLTWISCFSYVLGLSLGLLTLLMGWRYLTSVSRNWRLLWGWLSMIAYLSGLLSSHVLILLPLVFIPLAWLIEPHVWRRGVFLTLLGLLVGAAAYAQLYYFKTSTAQPVDLLSLDFLTVYISSSLALLPILAIAYLFSFLGDSLAFLMAAFNELSRWSFALVTLAGWMLFVRLWKLHSRLFLSLFILFISLITPYLVWLYTVSDYVNYHPSYILTGRVFYIPFVAVALLCGYGSALALAGQKTVIRIICVLFSGLLLYFPNSGSVDDRFLGLTVVQGTPTATAPNWIPFANEHSLWSLIMVASLLTLFAYRIFKPLRRVQETYYESI